MGNYQGFTYEEYDDKYEDKLDILFNQQIKLQAKLKNDLFSQEYREKMLMALADETFEALRETPWKPWKKQQKYNKQKYQEELIDAWHFLINLSLSAGLSSFDVYEMFKNKNKENHDRQKRGY